MRRLWILLALAAASPAIAQVGSTALYTDFVNPPTPAILDSLREEVDTLMSYGGLHFVWKALPSDDNTTWTELAVLKFSGHCTVLPSAVNSNLDRRLGWTHVSDGVVLPFAEIDCDAIRAFLLKNLLTLMPESRDRAFGRAVGRVTAHELVHIFAQTTAHSSHGVDQSALSVAELLADRPRFDAVDPDFHILRPGKVESSHTRRPSAAVGQAIFEHRGCVACHGSKGEGTRKAPVLRVAGRILNSVNLAVKLTKCENPMARKAKSMKMATPVINEEELADLVSFLNQDQIPDRQ